MGKCPYVKMCCPVVWDKRKSEPMTNEGWFCGLPTEEKARLLVSNKLFFRMLDYDGFIEWLKEIHNDNS